MYTKSQGNPANNMGRIPDKRTITAVPRSGWSSTRNVGTIVRIKTIKKSVSFKDGFLDKKAAADNGIKNRIISDGWIVKTPKSIHRLVLLLLSEKNKTRNSKINPGQ